MDQRICGDVQCHDLIKVLAPIFAGNNHCSLLWDQSQFLVNDKPWQSVDGYENDFEIHRTNNKSEVTLKVTLVLDTVKLSSLKLSGVR